MEKWENELKVGFGFRPYEEELVGYFLHHKILGNHHLVQDFISEVDICKYDPRNLRLQSKIKSRDPVSYFFSRVENKYASGNQQSRTTPAGKWKLTGKHSDVKDQWGIWSEVGGTIGFKRYLVFQKPNSNEKNDKSWSMQEFHYTLLPEAQKTYVICRLEYKGNDRSIILGNPTAPMTNSPGSVVDQPVQGNTGSLDDTPQFDLANQAQWSFPDDLDMQQSFQANLGYFSELDFASHSPWSSDIFDLQQQAPYSALYRDGSQMMLNSVVEENYDFLFDETTSMEANFNNHRPKSPVTGVLAGSSSDSDTDSMIFGDTSSSTNSVGSSNGSWQTPRDDTLSLSSIDSSMGNEESQEQFKREYINHEAQEQPKPLKLQLQGKEKVINLQKRECEWKMAEDSVKKAHSTTAVKQSWIVLEEVSQRNSQWTYVKNMISILLFISIIGWIILVD